MNYIEWAKEMFQNDHYATKTTGIEILEVAENYAKCKLDIEEKHKNAAGTVMGGAIFTLADFTFAIAANAGNPLTVSLSSQISFLAPGIGPVLYATAECIKNGRTTCFFELRITDEEDQDIAIVTITGFRKQN